MLLAGFNNSRSICRSALRSLQCPRRASWWSLQPGRGFDKDSLLANSGAAIDICMSGLGISVCQALPNAVLISSSAAFSD